MESVAKRLECDKIPKYQQNIPLTISDKDKKYLMKETQNIYDPFGDAYIGLKESLHSKYAQLNIPIDIVHSIISYLGYMEDTMKLPFSTYISNPTIEYGTEGLILISPPIKTHLLSNCYILHSIRYKIGKSNAYISDNAKIFIGIQILNPLKLEAPGDGDIIYSKKMNIKKDDDEFIIYPLVDLICGKSYLFWITCLDGTFSSEVASNNAWLEPQDGGQSKDELLEKEKALKFTDSYIMYYKRRQTENLLMFWKSFMNYYEIVFRPKI
eukprot:528288_1